MSIKAIKDIIAGIQKILGLDLALVLVLATILIITALTLPDGNVLRIVFGLPFVLFLPGYSLVSALWAKKSELDGLERVALSLGLSIAIVPLVGLGLNYTPWGITLISIVISMYCLILIMVGITWFRRSRLSIEDRFVLNLDLFYDKMAKLSSTDKLIAFMVAAVLVIGVGLLIYIALNPPREKYTELYILDENGTIDNHPSSLEVNESASVIIVVVCHEQENTDYSTVIKLVPEDGANRTLEEYNFSLVDGEKWSETFNFSVNESGNFKLEVELFKEDETVPYRTNHIRIDVKS